LLVALATLVNSYICFRNFGTGLMNHIGKGAKSGAPSNSAPEFVDESHNDQYGAIENGVVVPPSASAGQFRASVGVQPIPSKSPAPGDRWNMD
jgi:hypothetical protein